MSQVVVGIGLVLLVVIVHTAGQILLVGRIQRLTGNLLVLRWRLRTGVEDNELQPFELAHSLAKSKLDQCLEVAQSVPGYLWEGSEVYFWLLLAENVSLDLGDDFRRALSVRDSRDSTTESG